MIDLVESVLPDILILDIQVPLMDGVDVLKVLSNARYDTEIIVLSAVDDPGFIKEVLSMGACLFVVKGDVQDLSKAVQKVVNGECEHYFA